MRGSRLALIAVLLAALAPPGTAAAQTSEELAARRKRIDEMSPADKQQLLLKQKRFAELPADEQERLRLLDEKLRQAPDAAVLRRAMKHYCELLNALPPGQRDEVAEKAPDERVAFLKTVKQEQSRSAESQAHERLPIPPEDARLIVRFMEDRIWPRREELLKEVPQANRTRIESLGEARRRTALLGVALQRWNSVGQSLFSPDAAALQELVKQLSPATQQHLASQPLEQRQQTLHQLLRDTSAERFKELTAWMPKPGDLERIFEHDLTSEERERLLSLSAEERRKELRELYFQHQFGGHRPASDRPRRGLKSGSVRGQPPPSSASPAGPSPKN